MKSNLRIANKPDRSIIFFILFYFILLDRDFEKRILQYSLVGGQHILSRFPVEGITEAYPRKSYK